MADCWAITQSKGRRCGRCKGDCNFEERPKRRGNPRTAASMAALMAVVAAGDSRGLQEWVSEQPAPRPVRKFRDARLTAQAQGISSYIPSRPLQLRLLPDALPEWGE